MRYNYITIAKLNKKLTNSLDWCSVKQSIADIIQKY